MTAAVPPGSWTWSRAAPSRSSKPGWPPSPTRGVSVSRSSLWMDSPGLRAPPPKNSPTQGQLWIPSTLYTSPGMLSMSVVGAFSKNSTTGVGGPRISLQGPQDVAHQILTTHRAPAAPDTQPVFRRRARRTRGPWSAYQNVLDAYRAPNTSAGKALMRAEIERLSNAGVPSSLTEIITLGRTLKRRAGDILAYFDHPHTTGGPAEAINAPPRTPTRLHPSTSETSPTTSPDHSSKPEDSNPQQHLQLSGAKTNHKEHYSPALFASLLNQFHQHMTNIPAIRLYT